MGKEIDISFNDLDDFYREATLFESTGNRSMYDEFTNSADPDFVGLSLKEIPKYMYSYEPGMENIRELTEQFQLGSSRFTYKWDETDGDEMDMVRAYDGLPFLKRRKRTVGNNTGKFVTIHINIVESWFVGYSHLLNKAFTAASLVNHLQTMGYRVAVNVVQLTRSLGSYKGQRINKMRLVVPLKKFEEPLNLSLLLTCISPWMFRHWMFRFEAAKFYVDGGMGSPLEFHAKDTITDIYIDNGQCLTPEDADEKIKSIADLFESHLKEKE